LRETADSIGIAPLPRRASGILFSFIVVLSFWAIASYFDQQSEPLNSIQPQRYAGLQFKSDYKDLRISLALSGGGYRAAIMHAGVLNALETEQMPLKNISAVSGGAIIGSYYAAGGSPTAFRDSLLGHRFNLKRELCDIHNAFRLLTPLRLPGTKIRLLPFGDFD
jgi:hypothetical protein